MCVGVRVKMYVTSCLHFMFIGARRHRFSFLFVAKKVQRMEIRAIAIATAIAIERNGKRDRKSGK